ncbi:MAG: ribonuclease Z [Clostridia bacterium]|nr:ribonuclease Z [Clostridia bacterium]
MTVFVCIDERGGMMFNKRRQSRDRRLIDDIARHAGDAAIYISDYSESLFEESEASVICVSNPLESAREDSFVFVENLPLYGHLDKIDTLVIYNWNRHYPSDVKLDIKPLEVGFRLGDSYDFEGSSHEKITKEVYIK